MNKTGVRIAAVLSIVSCALLNATTEFRSPLSLYRGVMHWPLPHVKESWWYDVMYPEDEVESTWNVHTWSGTYYRCADKAFCDPCKKCEKTCVCGECKDKCPTDFKLSYPCRNKSTSKTTSLATLWFGRDCFRGEETFAGGRIDDTELLTNKNPFLAFARIFPRFDYNERGAVWGMHVDKRFGKEEKGRFGFRVSLPFKVIEIEQNSCKLEETLDDVIVEKTIQVDAQNQPNQVDYAYRLDFLSALNLPVPNPPSVVPVVRYGDGTLRTQVAGIDADGATPGTAAQDQDPPDQQKPPVYLMRRECGAIPCPPFRKKFDEVNGDGLPAGGASGLANDTIFHFKTDTDYASELGQDRCAQSELFLIPRRLSVEDEILNLANTIRDRIKAVVNDLMMGRETAVEFFRSACCIDLCKHERIHGLGNLDTEFYVGYGPEHWFVNFLTGVRFPTDKRLKDPHRVFFQTTGNNGHYEIKLGMEGGWMPFEWFAFKLDWTYNHAFRRHEFRAAPFKGATIRNIGPCIDTKVSWDYFVGHVDLNFFHPRNPDLGGVFGYELFAKREDNVRFDDCKKGCGSPTAVDCLGREKELDVKILEDRTNAMTHKLRGELFHRWNFCELFAGASHIVGGKHAMQESEAHVGVAIYF